MTDAASGAGEPIVLDEEDLRWLEALAKYTPPKGLIPYSRARRLWAMNLAFGALVTGEPCVMTITERGQRILDDSGLVRSRARVDDLAGQALALAELERDDARKERDAAIQERDTLRAQIVAAAEKVTASREVMELHILFGQRVEQYEGEYAPEVLLCWEGPSVDENPDGWDEALAAARNRTDMVSMRVVKVLVDVGRLRKLLLHTPVLAGEVVE